MKIKWNIICQKFCTKSNLNLNLNDLVILYGSAILNLDLGFNQAAN